MQKFVTFRSLSFVFIIGGITLFGFFGCGDRTGKGERSEENSHPSEMPDAGSVEFSIMVNYGDSTDEFRGLPWEPEMSVYQAMQKAGENAGFSFRDSTFPGIGKFIVAINEVRYQPDAGQYWLYCIDNISAIEGVEEMTLEGGQQIQWFLGEKTPCEGFGE